MIINTQNLEQAKKQIKAEKQPIIIKAQSYEFNRKILEYGKFQVLEALNKPLNHILANIATKNSIAIGLDLNELRKQNKKNKATALSTIIQNIKTLRKAKTKIALLSEKDKKNARALLISLEASTQQTKVF